MKQISYTATAACCTGTQDVLCHASDREWPEGVQRGFLALARAILDVVKRWGRNWHTGARSHELLDSLNDQQLRDIGMESVASRREREKLARKNHVWHLPLL